MQDKPKTSIAEVMNANISVVRSQVHPAAPCGDVPSALTVDAQSDNAPRAGGSAQCVRCGGTGVVDDGEIDCYSNGEPFANGPIKCVKDCPACTSFPSGLRATMSCASPA